jgi:hypothetical protein
VTADSGGAVRGRDLAGLWLLSIVASAVVGIHGVAYWDAGDYVRLAIDGGQSGLLLGRPLFLLVSRLILRTGVDPVHAEPVLRWFWCGVGAVAPPALAVLAVRLGLSRAAALAAGVALALSPSFAHTAHQVLTDAPSLALAIVALLAATHAQAALAGLLLAVAILTRETAAIHAVAVAILLGRRAIVAAGVCAAVMAATLWACPPPAFDAWMHAMARSVQAHPITAWQIEAPFLWILAAGPLPVAAGIVVLARRPPARWRIVSWPAVAGTLAILFYPDGWFSPRYMLATVPLACFLPAAEWLAARPRLLAAALIGPLVTLVIVTKPARVVAARAAAVMARVAALPAGAFVVPGHYCADARLGATIHRRHDLQMMCTGWEWPEDPARALDAALAAGHPVAMDLSHDAWMPPLETRDRDVVKAWAAGREGREISGFFVVER